MEILTQTTYKVNKQHVCLNPTVVLKVPLKNSVIPLLEVEVAEIKGKWYTGYSYMLKNSGMGSPCSVSKEFAYDSFKKAMLCTFDTIRKNLGKEGCPDSAIARRAIEEFILREIASKQLSLF